MPGMNGAQFIGGYSTAVAKDKRFEGTSILLMSGLPPSHFQDFLSEFSHLKVGILEKPFSLETLRRKLANIQGQRKLSGNLPRDVVSDAPPVSGVIPKIVPAQPALAGETSVSRPLPNALGRRSEPEG